MTVTSYPRIFLNWWASGLYQGLPSTLRQWFHIELPRLIIIPSDESIEVMRFNAYWYQAGKKRQLGEFSATPETDYLDLLPKRMRKKKFIIELQLASRHVLSLEKSFPESIKENLVQSIGYQIDRITPFSADKVYYSAVPIEHHKKNKMIVAEILVSPKRYVDALLTRLHNTGIEQTQIKKISVQAGDERANLAPLASQQGLANTKLSKFPLYLLIAALTAALIAPIAYKQRRVDQLDHAINDLRKNASAQLAIRDKLFAAEEALSFLQEKRESSPLALDVLEQLSQKMPQDTWLESFELNGQTLEIRGESDQALTLIDVLENAPEFSKVSFISPVALNKKTRKDKFHIKATVHVNKPNTEGDKQRG
ncbi:MAG: PilN domain-containing protein [bacterium]